MDKAIKIENTAKMNTFYFSFSLGYYYNAGYFCCTKKYFLADEFISSR